MSFIVLRIVFMLIGIVGTTFVVPIAVALYCNEANIIPSFLVPMILGWAFFVCGFLLKSKKNASLTTRGAFVVVAVGWISVVLFGSIPLYVSGAIPSITDAVFESVSGFTTTGATILPQVENLPRCINVWRCQTHWLGGMGIIALTVALMPLLGVGGFQLIKAETSGPEKGKLTPKITTTAKVLWFIYFGMTLLDTLLLKIAGMDFIDAIAHAFSTMGSGGFSTKNSSIGSYNSAFIDWICIFFMFCAGINFSLYYYAFTKKFDEVKKDSELKAYVCIVLIAIIVVAFACCSTYKSFFASLRYAAFHVVSVITSTGFSIDDFTFWLPCAQMVLFTLFFVGGSSGSTAGGVKVIRWVVLAKQFKNEILRMLHPHGVFTVRINNRAGRKDIVFTVTAFMFIFFVCVFTTTFFATLFGLDLLSSLSGALSMIGNIGIAFNKLGPSCNFGFLHPAVKWWYCVMMLAGRLEFYTIIILLLPNFARR